MVSAPRRFARSARPSAYACSPGSTVPPRRRRARAGPTRDVPGAEGRRGHHPAKRSNTLRAAGGARSRPRALAVHRKAPNLRARADGVAGPGVELPVAAAHFAQREACHVAAHSPRIRLLARPPCLDALEPRRTGERRGTTALGATGSPIGNQHPGSIRAALRRVRDAVATADGPRARFSRLHATPVLGQRAAGSPRVDARPGWRAGEAIRAAAGRVADLEGRI